MTPVQFKTLLAIIIGSSIVFLDGTVVSLALPSLATSLHAGFSGQQWVADGYLLTLSAFILLGGSLGDIYGRKKVYLIGAMGFGVTSLICATAQSIDSLIVARLCQGVFGALMIPGGLAIINANFSARLRGRAIGLWTAWTSAVMTIGPLVGGWLVDSLSWRWIFLMNVPLLLVVLALGIMAIRESKPERGRRIDVIGAFLTVIALGGVTYALIEGPLQQWGWMSQLVLIGGVISMISFVLWERRSRDPMLPLALFYRPNFAAVNAVTFAMYGALGGFFFAFSIYLQSTLHFSAMMAGLSSLPVALCLALFSSRVGAMAGTYGPRIFMTVGPLVAGIGVFVLSGLRPGANYVTDVLPGLILFGVGMGLTVAPLTMTVLASVTRDDSGIASAVNNALARVSGLFAVAALGIFGAQHMYQFAGMLSSGLAVGASVLALLFIRNTKMAR